MSGRGREGLACAADFARGLSEMARVLRPGGTLAVLSVRDGAVLAERLRALRFEDVGLDEPRVRTVVLRAASLGRFASGIVSGRKPARRPFPDMRRPGHRGAEHVAVVARVPGRA